jgi:hypothetical protein
METVMAGKNCEFCRPFRLEESALRFPCLECGRRMLLVAGDPGLEHVYHCPDHCTTLMPSPSMLAAARRGD